jgi:hypothetical protein
MPNLPANIQKEELSLIYLNALTVANGFGFQVIGRDYWGIDVLITSAVSPLLGKESLLSVSLKVQLKATVNLVNNPTAQQVKFRGLPMRNFNYLCQNYNMILAVLDLPKNPERWVEYESDYLLLRNRMYWQVGYKRSLPPFRNTKSVGVPKKATTLYIPTTQILHVLSLRTLMTRLAEHEYNNQPESNIFLP